MDGDRSIVGGRVRDICTCQHSCIAESFPIFRASARDPSVCNEPVNKWPPQVANLPVGLDRPDRDFTWDHPSWYRNLYGAARQSNHPRDLPVDAGSRANGTTKGD